MPLSIIHGDITEIVVDAIVNAANIDLKMGGGVCGAIFRAAGVEKLQESCDELAPIKTGQAVITMGHDSFANYIIHTAGPIYTDGTNNEESLLRNCYKNSLSLAEKCRCESIAFPLISSGIYGYPKEEAMKIAIEEISHFLKTSSMAVYIVIYNEGDSYESVQRI